MNKALIDRVCV